MAPEILKRQAYNEKADIFSLGVIVYELYTLRNPLLVPILDLFHQIDELVINRPPLPNTVHPSMK